MTVTAKTIARELQLSQPTVSRILSGDPQHRVAAATRQRVLETAHRLGYQPNAIARSLRRGRTGIVGLYTNHDYDARDDFLGTIIGGLQRCCETRGLDLLLHSGRGGRSAEEMYGTLRDGRIDGLVLHANADDPLVEMLGQSPLPVVTVADKLPNLSGVTCDDSGGIQQIMGVLKARGYRKFVFIAPEEMLTSVERRREAFEAEIQRFGIPAPDWMILRVSVAGVAGVVDRVRAFASPCAVVCWSDQTAYRLLGACRCQGIRVPEEMAVSGFDGFLFENVPLWELLTARCPWDDVAAEALNLLMERVEAAPGTISPIKEVCLPVTLCIGNTA